jgi:hypothetical protein
MPKMICPDCNGTGSYEASIGGDGYDDRCCALADVECVCQRCRGTGIIDEVRSKHDPSVRERRPKRR